MKTYRMLLVLALALALGLTACGGAGGGSGAASTSLKVDMVDFMFEPQDLTVPAGAEITIELTNKGAVDHEFVIMKLGTEATPPFDDDDEPNIYWEAEVEAGDSGTFTFTAPAEPGKYQVVCGIPGHLEAGMVGSLTVVSP
ncbi:MAG: hypothetical protein D6770_10800 [Anaerolineae bacterium]|nr:MAG: hypothetical protein D6770_10800 [Anaerolineae bacterium]